VLRRLRGSLRRRELLALLPALVLARLPRGPYLTLRLAARMHRGPARESAEGREVVKGRPSDVALVALLAIVCAVVSFSLPAGLYLIARVPAGLALVLALPGYAIAAAILPPAELWPAERFLLSGALSIATTIASALVLSVAQTKLTALPWASVIAAITVLAAAVARLRGNARAARLPRLSLRITDAIALLLAGALLAGAAWLGFRPLSAPPGTRGTTALSIAKCGPQSFEIGVSSDQLSKANFTLAIQVSGGGAQIFGPIELSPGSSWSRVVSTIAGSPQVTAQLFRTNQLSLYRSVKLDRGWNIPTSRCDTARRA